MKDFNTAAAEIGDLVTAKNAAYGDSFAKCGEFLRLLWPEGIPVSQYGDALCMCRIFDKQMRVATRKDAFGESPYRDIAGYGILGMVKDGTTTEEPANAHLCPSCRRYDTECHGVNREYPITDDGGCEGYIKAETGVHISGWYANEGQKVEREVSLCDSCDAACETRGIMAAHGSCNRYISETNGGISEMERTTYLCHSCSVPQCNVTTIIACETTGTCGRYQSALRERVLDAKEETVATAKQEPPTATDTPLDFTLPSITLKCTSHEAQRKFVSEVSEWRAAKKGSLHEMVERWDCLQALQTFYERGGAIRLYQIEILPIMDDLTKWFAEGRDVMGARAACLTKNAARSYYRPEVNAAIIASNGASFTPKEADA
jgi:hypothetical protein